MANILPANHPFSVSEGKFILRQIRVSQFLFEGAFQTFKLIGIGVNA